MECTIKMKIVGSEVKKGAKGDYLKVVALQGANVIQTFSRNLQLPTGNGQEQTFLINIKEYKGQLQSPEILKVV